MPATERLYSVKKSLTDTIPTSTLYTHYLQHAKTLSETEL